jgi:hypothetical protein
VGYGAVQFGGKLPTFQGIVASRFIVEDEDTDSRFLRKKLYPPDFTASRPTR